MVNLQSIRDMETLYDRGLLYRAVIESCSQKFGHDNQMRYLLLHLLLPREYYLATLINEYLSKNDLKHATEQICSLHSSEIQQIKGIYPSLFGRELEDDIETFTFGEHRKVYMFYVVLSCYITLMYKHT
ncbi:hypothetical protein TIFTF001_054517 [Ficus carica]|uniref:Uncharacterized protein n=1 Tax=Ficus carica TaxID=3494 RepID=A0AA88EI19_FICCA|nr:hypothetical protein TIFTF001_054513 [Ficus carica]GMN75084.1 hypothetical protein TIFTF001_054517 [Ficus carica]